ncbi:tol-pal system-associated acyl-CoA thioesterase [Metallibacterium sp.]|uniref:tol-pal system-associated acyl-CoA thioesterase n=1 Tax=Metallibacterium sp. TaxID=2940281 RepID=UPI00260E13B3|nr:tol-pal system-associated acyl-CoA thioesterase [Metallibacterium sp.]
MSAPASLFSWRIRVYWEDTDAGGVVYHASYLRFLERVRTEWLRAQGLEQTRVRAEQGVVFVVYGMNLRFRRPAVLDDEIDATLRVVARKVAALEFAQTLVRVADAVTLVEATVRVACVSATDFRPVPIPRNLLTEPTIQP